MPERTDPENPGGQQPAKAPVARRSKTIWIAAGLAGFVVLLLVVLATLDWNSMRGPVARFASARLHRSVRIDGDLQVRLFSWTPNATVTGLSIAQPDWAAKAGALADIDRLYVSLDLKSLLGGHIVLPELAIDSPRLDLRREASGRANWDFQEKPGNGGVHLPPIRHFVIKDGHIALTDARRRLSFTGTVASEENAGGGTHVFKLNGTGTLNGKAFAARLQGDPLLNVAPGKPYGFTAEIRSGATHIEAKGALDTPFDLASFHAATTATGPNLAELYDLTGLGLPNTPPYRLTGTLSRQGEKIRFAGFSGRLGESDLKGNLTVDIAGERPFVTADLSSQTLHFDDIGPLIGIRPSAASIAAGAPLAGISPASVSAAPVSPASTPPASRTPSRQAASPDRVLPDAPLRVERLRGMDAEVAYRAVKIESADFPLRSAALKLSLKNGVLTLDPVEFSFIHGTLAGDIKIDASKDVPATDMDVRLTGLRLEQFLSAGKTPPPLEGILLARAKLHGVGDSVRKTAATVDGSATMVVPHGAARKAFAELLGIDVASALGLLLTNDQSQTDIRCALADFSARKGVLNLDHLVFDTGVVSASGEGTVDLRSERIGLALSGHPKKPQLFRVRAPITIGGTLAKPEIGVKAGSAILQGGLAVGLAFVLTPLASVLPFVDPGLAKDADCASLLKTAQNQGAPVGSAPQTRSGR